MRHLSEEERILACYGELAEAETDHHLASCGSCAAEVTELKNLLEMATDDLVFEPDPGFEERTWATLRWRLHRRGTLRNRWLASAAALALLFIGFGAGRVLDRNEHERRAQPVIAPSHHTAASEIAGVSGQEAALASAGREQLDRSSRLLAEVSNQDWSDSGFGDVHANAETLLAGNRLVRAASRGSRAGEVGKLLDDLEPILIELAHSSGMSSEELSAIQQRIAARELLFKIRVVSSTLREAQQKRSIIAPAHAGASL
ncbi:MAG: hypothetical protein ABIP63_10575 [Thermoanaerobaculia bacterium]